MKPIALFISLFVTCAFCGCTSAPPKAKTPIEVHPPSARDGKYTVIAGDTAAKIAMKFGIMLADLVALNPSQDWAKLKVGQQIIISK